ncbi:MAG TPA: hypothetical protein VLW53_12960, partial [Candidatus Eisenbacteria bacterium]|nr:hypothetical protein [Candidatus Eisenbacteria bacterium]
MADVDGAACGGFEAGGYALVDAWSCLGFGEVGLGGEADEAGGERGASLAGCPGSGGGVGGGRGAEGGGEVCADAGGELEGG